MLVNTVARSLTNLITSRPIFVFTLEKDLTSVKSVDTDLLIWVTSRDMRERTLEKSHLK